MPCSNDDVSHHLRYELDGLRMLMKAEGNRVPIPARFTVTEHPDKPAFIIRDAETDRTSYVPAFAYASVRATLADLFGPGGEAECGAAIR